MTPRRAFLGLFFPALVLGLAALAVADKSSPGDRPKATALGAAVPKAGHVLRDLRGNRRPLYDFKGHKAIVVAFLGVVLASADLHRVVSERVVPLGIVLAIATMGLIGGFVYGVADKQPELGWLVPIFLARLVSIDRAQPAREVLDSLARHVQRQHQDAALALAFDVAGGTRPMTRIALVARRLLGRRHRRLPATAAPRRSCPSIS